MQIVQACDKLAELELVHTVVHLDQNVAVNRRLNLTEIGVRIVNMK